MFVAIDEDRRTIRKLGEWPPPGPPLPRKLQSLVGDGDSLLLKGYQAERQGFGLGAVAYYRRVVEDHWKDLLRQALRVAREEGGDAMAIGAIEGSLAEWSFKESLRKASGLVPRSLFIKNHNPFPLMHAALSRNLHGKSDAECLELARGIRELLHEFARHVQLALSDNEALRASIQTLTEKSGVSGLK